MGSGGSVGGKRNTHMQHTHAEIRTCRQSKPVSYKGWTGHMWSLASGEVQSWAEFQNAKLGPRPGWLLLTWWPVAAATAAGVLSGHRPQMGVFFKSSTGTQSGRPKQTEQI